MGYNGVLFIGRYDNTKQNSNLWAFTMMDTVFSETWKKYFSINTKYALQQFDTLGNELFLLFANLRDVKESLILTINILSGTFKVIMLKHFLPIYQTHFLVIDEGKKILVGGYFNARPLVLMFEIENSSARILPGFFNFPGTLYQLSKNEQTGVIEIVIRNRINNKTQGLWLKTFNYEGEIIHDVQLPYTTGQIVTQGRSVFTDDYLFVSSGTYSRKSTYYNNGFYFISPHTDNENPRPEFINFADLNNFFSYMSPRRQKHIGERIKNKRLLGKEKHFSYRVLLHSFSKVDDTFVLFGEIYSKSSSSNSYSSSFFTAAYRSVLEVYRYTSGFILSFDQQGRLVWDQAVKIEDYKSYFLSQKSTFHVDDNTGIIMYAIHDKIHYKIFSENETLVDRSEVSIEPKGPNDKIVWQGNSSVNVQNWYDNKFLVYGTHYVKNLYDRTENSRRKVFYINKMDYSARMTSN